VASGSLQFGFEQVFITLLSRQRMGQPLNFRVPDASRSSKRQGFDFICESSPSQAVFLSPL
jgi:hypothetical protein